MSLTKKVAFVILFAICASATVAAIWENKKDRNHRTPYTIVWKGILNHGDGKEEQAYTEQRYLSANGNWRSVKQYSDGHTRELVADNRGVFSIHPEERKMYFLSGHSRHVIDPETYRLNSDYSRTEMVLGYVTYVDTEVQGDVTIERYHAVALNGDIIKHVFRRAGFVRILEPTEVILGEPASESLMHDEFPIEVRKQKTGELSE